VLLIDLADADGEPFTPESMLAGDGVHLRAAGQEWLAGRVHAHLVSDGRRE
jgi:lysophospholipase L1-like esterase